MDDYLKPREVAKTLRLSVLTIKRMIKRGELKAIKVGSRGDYRIQVNDLKMYLEERKR